MKAVITLTLFLLPVGLLAQPDSLWSRTYGGTDHEYCYTVRPLDNGEFILAGYTESYGEGSNDFYLVRTDSDGNALWSRTYGGSASDGAWQVRPLQDGGFIVVGFTESFGAGSRDAWLLRTDESGDSLWSRTYGTANYQEMYAVEPTSDGGFVMAGIEFNSTNGSWDYWGMKTDELGNTEWERMWGFAAIDMAVVVQPTSDGGYIFGGGINCANFECGQIWLVKTNALGDTLWTRMPDGNNCWSLRETRDNGFILIGDDTVPNHGKDILLIKTDSQGATQWRSTFGGLAEDLGGVVEETWDGCYILAGYTHSFGAGGRDLWLLKANIAGDSLWSRTFGGTANESCSSIQQAGDLSYVMAGGTASFGAGNQDFWFVRTTPDAPIAPAEVQPTELDFGAGFYEGLPEILTVTVLSHAEHIFDIMTVDTPEGFGTDFVMPITVFPGDSAHIDIHFTAEEPGDYSGVVVISTTAMTMPLIVQVSGTRWLLDLDMTPDTLDFGTVWVGEDSSQQLVIHNESEGAVTITELSVVSGEEDFAWSHADPHEIEPGSTYAITVTFTPTGTRLYEELLQIGHSVGPDFAVFVPLLGDGITDAANEFPNSIPSTHYLAPNYPNPFNPATTITFGLPREENVTLTVFDVTGRRITVLADGYHSAGHHTVRFDGSSLSSGIYFYTLQAGSYSSTQKMILLR